MTLEESDGLRLRFDRAALEAYEAHESDCVDAMAANWLYRVREREAAPVGTALKWCLACGDLCRDGHFSYTYIARLREAWEHGEHRKGAKWIDRLRLRGAFEAKLRVLRNRPIPQNARVFVVVTEHLHHGVGFLVKVYSPRDRGVLE